MDLDPPHLRLGLGRVRTTSRMALRLSGTAATKGIAYNGIARATLCLRWEDPGPGGQPPLPVISAAPDLLLQNDGTTTALRLARSISTPRLRLGEAVVVAFSLRRLRGRATKLKFRWTSRCGTYKIKRRPDDVSICVHVASGRCWELSPQNGPRLSKFTWDEAGLWVRNKFGGLELRRTVDGAVLLSTRFIGLHVRWVAGDLVGVYSVADARHEVRELPDFKVLRSFHGGKDRPFFVSPTGHMVVTAESAVSGPCVFRRVAGKGFEPLCKLPEPETRPLITAAGELVWLTRDDAFYCPVGGVPARVMSRDLNSSNFCLSTGTTGGDVWFVSADNEYQLVWAGGAPLHQVSWAERAVGGGRFGGCVQCDRRTVQSPGTAQLQGAADVLWRPGRPVSRCATCGAGVGGEPTVMTGGEHVVFGGGPRGCHVYETRAGGSWCGCSATRLGRTTATWSTRTSAFVWNVVTGRPGPLAG